MQYTSPVTAFSKVNRMCVIHDRKWIRREIPKNSRAIKRGNKSLPRDENSQLLIHKESPIDNFTPKRNKLICSGFKRI